MDTGIVYGIGIIVLARNLDRGYIDYIIRLDIGIGLILALGDKEVLDIIDNTPELYTDSDGKTIELRKLRLRWRFDGKAWEYMYERFFPAMRSFNLQIVVDWRELDINRVEHSIKSQAVVQQAETSIKSCPPPTPFQAETA